MTNSFLFLLFYLLLSLLLSTSTSLLLRPPLTCLYLNQGMAYETHIVLDVLNALDTEYVSYAEDQGFEDDGSNSAPKVFYGSGRQIRMSLKVSL